MINYANKISPCMILIQETVDESPVQFDAYLQESAIHKYYIGIGQSFMQYQIRNKTSGRGSVNVTYPIIQIDENGLTAVKCPTISGGKWLPGVKFPLCSSEDVFDIKGKYINVMTRYPHYPESSIFWVYLIIFETLKCKPIFYDPNYRFAFFVDLTTSYILPLQKYKNFTLVS